MAKAIPAPVVFGGLSLILARENGNSHLCRSPQATRPWPEAGVSRQKVAVTVFGMGMPPGDSVDPGGRGISIRREQIRISSAR